MVITPFHTITEGTKLTHGEKKLSILPVHKDGKKSKETRIMKKERTIRAGVQARRRCREG